MTNPITVVCHFCGAAVGAPCRSVGKLPIVEPHMQRVRLAGDAESGPGRDAYARAVVTAVFGDCTPELLERAKKDRSIDARKPWVRRALALPPTPRVSP